MRTVPPGGTIGILGGGQLGRMLALAAAPLGYRCRIFAPEPSGPAAEVSAGWQQGEYRDGDALARFAAGIDVLTYEFENVAADALAALAGTLVFPPPHALALAQDRASEKGFVQELGGCTAPYRRVDDQAGLEAALADLGTPAILKTRRFGYDGKGQVRIAAAGEAVSAWEAIGRQPAVLEGVVAFDHEFSILLVRGQDGVERCWPAPTNVHREGILRTSTVPAHSIVHDQAPAAAHLAARIAEALDYVGVLACEFFAGADGPVFNEMAPRVHNSGHWTIEGAVTSQFENHVRAICGLPLGETRLAGAGASMENLIGTDADRWPAFLAEPGAHLHLYGKREARPGRKMGHVTRVG